MTDVLRPSVVTPEQQFAAREIYTQFWIQQTSGIRACLGPVPGKGTVFFPYPDNKIYSVEILKFAIAEPSPLPFAKTQRWLIDNVGIPQEEIPYSFTQIREGYLKDPTTIYERSGTQITEQQYWVTDVGKVYQKNPKRKVWGKGSLSEHGITARRKVGKLERMPGMIKEYFPTYDAFREALGDGFDTNGIGYYAPHKRTDTGEQPWNLYRRPGGLPQLVAEAKKIIR